MKNTIVLFALLFCSIALSAQKDSVTTTSRSHVYNSFSYGMGWDNNINRELKEGNKTQHLNFSASYSPLKRWEIGIGFSRIKFQHFNETSNSETDYFDYENLNGWRGTTGQTYYVTDIQMPILVKYKCISTPRHSLQIGISWIEYGMSLTQLQWYSRNYYTQEFKEYSESTYGSSHKYSTVEANLTYRFQIIKHLGFSTQVCYSYNSKSFLSNKDHSAIPSLHLGIYTDW